MSKQIKDFVSQVADLYPEAAADFVEQIQTGKYFWLCNMAHASGIEIPVELSDWKEKI